MTSDAFSRALADRNQKHKDKRRDIERYYGLPERVNKSDARECILMDWYYDPSPTLVMLQMIANAYEDQRVVWDPENNGKKDSEDPVVYSPVNHPEKEVEHFLESNCFLSRPENDDARRDRIPFPVPEPRLRRMTRADTRALLACSVRRKNIHRSIFKLALPPPEFYPFERRVPGFNLIKHDDFKYMVWLKPTFKGDSSSRESLYRTDSSPKTEQQCTRYRAYFIGATIFYSLMFSVLIIIILVALWKGTVAIVSGILNFAGYPLYEFLYYDDEITDM